MMPRKSYGPRISAGAGAAAADEGQPFLSTGKDWIMWSIAFNRHAAALNHSQYVDLENPQPLPEMPRPFTEADLPPISLIESDPTRYDLLSKSFDRQVWLYESSRDLALEARRADQELMDYLESTVSQRLRSMMEPTMVTAYSRLAHLAACVRPERLVLERQVEEIIAGASVAPNQTNREQWAERWLLCIIQTESTGMSSLLGRAPDRFLRLASSVSEDRLWVDRMRNDRSKLGGVARLRELISSYIRNVRQAMSEQLY